MIKHILIKCRRSFTGLRRGYALKTGINRISQANRRLTELEEIEDRNLLNDIEGYDEILRLVRTNAIFGRKISNKMRGVYFRALRKSHFFYLCGMEEFRWLNFEMIKHTYGALGQQEDVFSSYCLILQNSKIHPVLKIELSLEMLEKYLKVFGNLDGHRPKLFLFETPIAYLNSSLELMTVDQVLKSYYYNSWMRVSVEDDIERQEERILQIWDDEMKKGELVKATTWNLVNGLWSLAAVRSIDLDFNDGLIIYHPRQLTQNQQELAQIFISILRDRQGDLTPKQTHRLKFSLSILSKDDFFKSDLSLLEFPDIANAQSNPTELTSRVQKDIIAVLRASGYTDLVYENPLSEFIIQDIYLPSQNVSFEINGPQHYIPHDNSDLSSLLTSSLINLSSQLDHECFAYPINSQDWNELKGLRQKELYLENLLKTLQRKN